MLGSRTYKSRWRWRRQFMCWEACKEQMHYASQMEDITNLCLLDCYAMDPFARTLRSGNGILLYRLISRTMSRGT